MQTWRASHFRRSWPCCGSPRRPASPWVAIQQEKFSFSISLKIFFSFQTKTQGENFLLNFIPGLALEEILDLGRAGHAVVVEQVRLGEHADVGAGQLLLKKRSVWLESNNQGCARHTLMCISRPTPRQSRGPSTEKK